MATLDEWTRGCIIHVLFRHLDRNEWDVILFGSFARGSANAGSDIDLAVRGPRFLAPATAARIVAELEEMVPTLRDFDLVDLRRARPALAGRVMREGVTWHKAPETQRD